MTTPQPEDEFERPAGLADSETSSPDSESRTRGSRVRESVQNVGFGLATTASGLDLVGYDDLALAMWAGSILLLVAGSDRTKYFVHAAWSTLTKWTSSELRE
ncbi:hypothetical protein [Nocardia salmonicida]|uniref:hypothetical protein n=1 Tax=Nocardia salmonicida TaxID=53431 RepID=UPI003626749B